MRAKQRWTLLIAGLAVAVVLGVKAFVFDPKPMDSVAARARGNPQAKVQIIEFIDFQCPACANGSKVLKESIEQHPRDIRVQVKYFPLVRTHSHAMQSALYSECAGQQNKFWEFNDLLMPSQPQWAPLLSADAVFMDMARQAGLDTAKLNACLASERSAKTINDDQSLGKSLGVQSTPTYFINNKMVVGVKSLMDELDTYFPRAQQ